MTQQLELDVLLLQGQRLLGGYSGNDPILSTGQFVATISRGTVQFVLLSYGAARRARENLLRDSPVSRWVVGHCAAVPAELWRPPGRLSPAKLKPLVPVSPKVDLPGSVVGELVGSARGPELFDCAEESAAFVRLSAAAAVKPEMRWALGHR